MKPIDEEITALVLTRETNPVPQVRTAAAALVQEIRTHGRIADHLDSSLRHVSRDFGWDIAQEAKFLVKDLKLAEIESRTAA